MEIHLLKSKIHRAQVTASSLNYEGSLSIARDLMEAANLLPYERILCSNLANGRRFETYAIPAEHGSATIGLNGATAHLGEIGGPPYNHELRHGGRERGEKLAASHHRPGGKERDH